MPHVVLDRVVDQTREIGDFQKVIVFAGVSGGVVQVLVETDGGFGSIVANRKRWEAIIDAIKASLDEAGQEWVR